MLQLGVANWVVGDLKGCQLLEVLSSADMEKLINLRNLTLDGCASTLPKSPGDGKRWT